MIFISRILFYLVPHRSGPNHSSGGSGVGGGGEFTASVYINKDFMVV